MPARIAPALVARLFDQSKAARWCVSVEQFGETLEASVAHATAARAASAKDIERYLASIHLDDLALACACAAGSEPAWDHFVREYRPALYRSADAIDPTGGARNLADALYGELFGLKERDGIRQSLFRYFHGRSSLATWLRAVLAQRHVDRLRAGRRLDPLPDDDSEIALAASTVSTGAIAANPERPRQVEVVRRALAAEIASLAPRDRLRLSCYYAQDLTLAAIGRMLREHEGSVSRHLTRTRQALRAGVESRLRTDYGLDATAVAEAVRSVVEDPGSIDVADLMGAGGGKNPPRDRSR
jgi:RNA polymerase sigma-70 factor (ECF subfamily)